MDLTQLVVIGCVILLGSALQAAIGFGSGLFSVPIMVWAGVPLPSAVAIAGSFVVGHNTWGAYYHRHSIRWRSILLISLACVVTIPLGVRLLGLVVTFGEGVVKLAVGCGLLVVLGLTSAVSGTRRSTVLAWPWTVLAGVSSGVLGGLVGMGGPPLVMWVMAHDWPVNQTRASLWAIFMFALPVTLVMLWQRFGDPILVAAGIGLLGMPLTVAGAALGLRLSRNMSRQRLRQVSFVVLTIIALSLIMQGLWPNT